MREVKIVPKTKIEEFRNIYELLEKEEFIGVVINDVKYFLCKDKEDAWGRAINIFTVVDLLEYETDDLCNSNIFRFFCFDSANELYRWMIEGE